jgi:2-polyprenyl-6-methoxyphenol hydroxylase-like FAD-dependent oxidoreductase
VQFHLDGFRPGDPDIADAQQALPPSAPMRDLPDQVDVLIVGSGPAGLTLAAQLAEFPDIDVAIIEAKPGPLVLGQADGIACRTMEMFQAFGFADRIDREACQINEVTFWTPDPERPEHIRRSDRIQDVEAGISEMPHVILNQARVHDHYLRLMRSAKRPLVPDYSRRLQHLEIGMHADDPVVATIERTDASGVASIETVRAKYVVGCDGARSAVRRSIGRTLVGDAANQAWGVMDVLASTDFPDIRYKSVIHSATEGNILVIPREGGYLFRLYIELDKLGENERVADQGITVDHLIAVANRVLQPYTLTVHEVPWWSIYEIGQRMCDKYDDVDFAVRSKVEHRRLPKVFIAGDACHTHSPKAGQGMNVSMQDGFNLGWKLAAVLRGQADPALLHSYSEERVDVARALLNFDRKLAAMFSAKPTTGTATESGAADERDGIDPAVFQGYFQQQARFTAGVATCYPEGPLTGPSTHQHLAVGFVVGMRFHSAPVVRFSDAKPMHLGHVHRADGRWRLYGFADSQAPDHSASRLSALMRWLSDSADSPIVRSTPAGHDVDSVFDVRAILQQPHDRVEPNHLPALLRPRKGRYGLIDSEKVFCPDFLHDADVFDLRGVDRSGGALVVVRPDQYIAQVLPLDGFTALSEFFSEFMLQKP